MSKKEEEKTRKKNQKAVRNLIDSDGEISLKDLGITSETPTTHEDDDLEDEGGDDENEEQTDKEIDAELIALIQAGRTESEGTRIYNRMEEVLRRSLAGDDLLSYLSLKQRLKRNQEWISELEWLSVVSIVMSFVGFNDKFGEIMIVVLPVLFTVGAALLLHKEYISKKIREMQTKSEADTFIYLCQRICDELAPDTWKIGDWAIPIVVNTMRSEHKLREIDQKALRVQSEDEKPERDGQATPIHADDGTDLNAYSKRLRDQD